jgi:hypothetical protein
LKTTKVTKSTKLKKSGLQVPVAFAVKKIAGIRQARKQGSEL